MTDAVALSLEDVPDGGALGLDPDPQTGAFRSFAVRRGDRVWAYRNRCPHRNLPLDDAGRFLTHDGAFVLCINHVALFRVEDGGCADGPCAGRGLEPLPVVLTAQR